MQNKKDTTYREGEEEVQHMHYALAYLKELWLRPHEPSFTVITQMAETLLEMEEPYRSSCLQTIAEHLINNMSLHYLELISTFKQKATQEGIDQEEQVGTLEDTKSGVLQMMDLSQHVSVRSIDDLVKLSNATIGWYRPSQVSSAEQAQWWLYRLPKVYSKQLGVLYAE